MLLRIFVKNTCFDRGSLRYQQLKDNEAIVNNEQKCREKIVILSCNKKTKKLRRLNKNK